MTVEPPTLHQHASLLGTVACDECGTSWPCRLSAWGNPARDSSCNVKGCDGRVTWLLFEADR